MRLYTGLVIAWTIVIFWATLTPAESLPESGLFDFPFFDKIAHFGLFVVFSYLLSGALWHRAQVNIAKSTRFFLAFTIAFVMSLLIEFLQKLIPGRDFEILDILANLAGTVVGFLVWEMKLLKFSR